VDDFDKNAVHHRIFAFYEKEFPFSEELVSGYIFSLMKASLDKQVARKLAVELDEATDSVKVK
jgi:hypothetical protein